MTPEERAAMLIDECSCDGGPSEQMIASAIRAAEQEAFERIREACARILWKAAPTGHIQNCSCQECLVLADAAAAIRAMKE